jgi:hypothetical protein
VLPECRISSMVFGEGVAVRLSLGVEGPEILHQLEPLFWVRNCIKGTVEFALGSLNQSVPEPLSYL